MKALRVFLCCLVLALLWAVTARAELTAKGDLFVNFSGGISPGALPRDSLAPIAVHLAGTLASPAGAQSPALRRIQVAINRGGKLDTRGLPVCPKSLLESATPRAALARCGDALVGRGSFAAAVAFPEQSSYPSHGAILAFNSIVDGHRAILAHVFGAHPAPVTRVIVFRIHQSAGTYGTVLTGAVPASVNRWGHATQISLDLHRRFAYRGTLHSYLSAACSAPAGFPGAVFPFARASMSFSNGATLTSTLIRSCKVRE